MIYIFYENDKFRKPIEYTFNTLFKVWGIDYQIQSYKDTSNINKIADNTILILYGNDNLLLDAKCKIHIYPSELFGNKYMTQASMPQLPLDRIEVDGREIPIIYAGTKDLPGKVTAVSKGGRKMISQLEADSHKLIATKLDIIASAFFMLSRYEEIVNSVKDQYDRFPAKESIAYKADFLGRPIVNEYMELLWNWVDAFNTGIQREPLWPNGKEFAVCLTHDIDILNDWNIWRIFREGKHCAALCLKHRRPVEAIKYGIKATKFLLKGNNPSLSIEEIINKEREYEFSSSFYFLANRFSPMDGKGYKLRDKNIQKLLRLLRHRNMEIGLHGSFESYKNESLLKYELDKLNRYTSNILGIRQHWLRFEVPTTFAVHETVGLKYDVTLGYAEHEGWRTGFSFPYYPYNFKEDRPFDILEIPLTIMDVTLSKYRALNTKEAWKVTENMLKTTKEYGGCCTLLWHNTHFDELVAPGYRKIYWLILDWIKQNNGWGTSGREIYKWWIKREKR